MLPKGLYSKYEQYKRDTAVVTQWLATTAISLGFKMTHDIEPPQAHQSSGRLKGKARAQAKIAAVAQPSTVMLKVHMFMPMAKHVAANAIAVPDYLKYSLDRAIERRTRFAVAYKKHTIAKSLEDNGEEDTHEFFLLVLREVQTILRPLMSVKNIKTVSASSQEKSDAGCNRFAKLTLSEPSKRFQDAPDTCAAAHPLPSAPRYCLLPDDPKSEAHFAFSNIIEDLILVRDSINTIWQGVLNGDTDPAAAALATETALRLSRAMTEEHELLFDKHGGLSQLITENMERQMAAAMDGPPDSSQDTGGEPASTSRSKSFGVCSRTFYRALSALVTIMDNHRRGEILIINDITSKSPAQLDKGVGGYVYDVRLAAQLFYDYLIARRLDKGYYEEAFMNTVGELDNSGRITLHAVFQLQVLIDVSRRMIHSETNPFNLLMAETEPITKDIAAHLRAQELSDHWWSMDNNKRSVRLREDILWTRSDPVGEDQRREVRSQGGTDTDIGHHRFLKSCPITTGLLLFFYRGAYRRLGLAVAQSWNVVPFAGHIYNALLHEGLLKESRWAAMELAFDILGKATFFVGGVESTTPTEYVRAFKRQMQFAQKKVTRSHQNLKAGKVSTGPQAVATSFEAIAVISEIFMEEYATASRAPMTSEMVQRILKLSQCPQQDAVPYEEHSQSCPNDATRSSDNTSTEKAKNDRLRAAARLRLGRNDGHKYKSYINAIDQDIGIDRFIPDLAVGLDSETRDFTFPLLRLHNECWDLLSAMKDNGANSLEKGLSSLELGSAGTKQKLGSSDMVFPTMVECVLNAASQRSGTKGRKVLDEVAKVVKDFINTGSDEATWRGYERTTNTEGIASIHGTRDKVDEESGTQEGEKQDQRA